MTIERRVLRLAASLPARARQQSSLKITSRLQWHEFSTSQCSRTQRAISWGPRGRLLIKYRRDVVVSPVVSFVDVRCTTQMLFRPFHSLKVGIHFTSSDCQQLRTSRRPCPFSVLLHMGAAVSAKWSRKRLTALLSSGWLSLTAST